MTLLVQIRGRVVTLALANGSTVLSHVDATWRVGSGETFLSYVQTLVDESLQSITAIDRVVVSLSEPSYTTVRTVLAFVNTLAWSQPVTLVEAPETYADLPVDQFLSAVESLPVLERKALFPTYQ